MPSAASEASAAAVPTARAARGRRRARPQRPGARRCRRDRRRRRPRPGGSPASSTTLLEERGIGLADAEARRRRDRRRREAPRRAPSARALRSGSRRSRPAARAPRSSLEAVERVRVEIVERVRRGRATTRRGFSIPRCPQSASCSSPRSIVTPSAAQTTCGCSPARSASSRHQRSSSTSVSPTSKTTAFRATTRRARDPRGVVTLSSRGSPSTTRDAPAGPLDERRAVGRAREIARERPAKSRSEERLRRLRARRGPRATTVSTTTPSRRA